MAFRLSMWLLFLAGGALGGFWLDSLLFKNIHNNIVFHFVLFVIGALLLWLVMKISRNTGRTLAKYGRKGDLPRMQTNQLVKDGVYAYMRHPMHLGLFLFPLAVAFLVGSPSFIFIIAPAEIIFMLIMIKTLEEREALAKFGDEYREYMKRVPAFCLKIKCIKELLKSVPKNE